MRKMKMLLKTLFPMLALSLALCINVQAADSKVTYQGGAEKFVFLPGSEYSDTDLFENFKNAMPGDTLVQKITLRNTTRTCDYVNIYMRAEAHDETANPLSSEVAASGENVAAMSDFLKQLSMTVKAGNRIIYEASPDELDGLASAVYLGSLEYNDKIELTVELEVPIELGNEYADRAGEVDWIFIAEEIDEPEEETKDTTPTQYGPSVGNGAKTGDAANPIVWIVVIVGAVIGAIAVYKKRKSEKS